MKLSFYGADRSVTGSCHMVECAGKRILIDCGLHQGSRELDEENSQSAAMIQMGMGQQYVVDAGRLEPERLRIFLIQLAATLVQPAVDQDLLPGALDHVTRAGDTAVSAVKRYFQVKLLVCAMGAYHAACNGSPLISCQ